MIIEALLESTHAISAQVAITSGTPDVVAPVLELLLDRERCEATPDTIGICSAATLEFSDTPALAASAIEFDAILVEAPEELIVSAELPAERPVNIGRPELRLELSNRVVTAIAIDGDVILGRRLWLRLGRLSACHLVPPAERVAPQAVDVELA
jgi:hypothetical protein